MASGVIENEARTAPASVPKPGWAVRFTHRLFEPVSIGMLAFFRISFGLIMAIEAYRYLSKGWVHRNYIDPDFHFTFFGFSWVKPWPGDGMMLTFIAMGVLALCIAAGAFYRVATVLFALNFAHIFLSEQAYYLNHFYLITIISFLMCVLPAHRAWSFDAWRRPALYSPTVPTWTLWLLRFQLGVAYVYGGIAKINSDWIHGEPMRMTLREHTDFPIFGRWFTEEWMVWFFTWGGMLFDLFIVPALLWPPTRFAAWIAALMFNTTNSILFVIGIFPWFMIAATAIFFPPDWLTVEEPAEDSKRAKPRSPEPAPSRLPALTSWQRWTVGLLAAWAAIQVLVPFRHLLYPGDVSWTEEGHHYAWHMKLRRKHGISTFSVVTQDGRRLSETELAKHAPPEQLERMRGRVQQLLPQDRAQLEERFLYITPRQRKKMSGRPEMILQYAHMLAEEFERAGYGKVAVYCDSQIGLNGRATQPLVDPNVDLAGVSMSLWPASWIVPLTQPLPLPGETVYGTSRDDLD